LCILIVVVWLLVLVVVRRVKVLTRRPTEHFLLLHHRLGSLLEGVELVWEMRCIDGRACLLNKIKVLCAAVYEVMLIHAVCKGLTIHMHGSRVAWWHLRLVFLVH
jgi:hypothetical protein